MIYVSFQRFSEAANAYENCDTSFKAVFARPKKQLEEKDSYSDYRSFGDESFPRYPNKRGYSEPNMELPGPERCPDGGYNKLMAVANPMLNQDQIWKLFDIIPSRLLNKN